MCKSNQEIHFCTCSSIKKKIFPKPFEDVENQRSEYERTHFIWKLSHYIGEKKSGMMGEMLMPVDKLNEDLTADFLLKKINGKNIFDFEYTPSEGDNLKIIKDYIYKNIPGRPRPQLTIYLSFIYRPGKWKEDFYNVFDNKIKSFKKGIIKINPEY